MEGVGQMATAVNPTAPDRPRGAAVVGAAVGVGGCALTLASLTLAIVDRYSPPFGALPGLSPEQTYALRLGVATLGQLVISVVAGLVLWRQPRNAFSWTFAVGLMSFVVFGFLSQYAVHGLLVAPASVPLAATAARIPLLFGGPALAAGLTSLMLFPSGRLKSARWAIVVALGAAVAVSGEINDLGSPYGLQVGFGETQPVPVTSPPELWPISAAWGLLNGSRLIGQDLQRWAEMLLAIGIGLGVILRMREAQSETRLQLKWFASAVAFGALAYLPARIQAWSIFEALPRSILDAIAMWSDFVGQAIGLSLLMPLAIAFAIFRYRLYAIDFVIGRTIVYGGLAAFVTLAYGITVAGVGSLLGQSAGLDPVLTIVAIAIIALLLEPVRSRLNTVANIAVYGKRSNPYEVLSNFARSVGRAEPADLLLPRMARLLRDGTAAQRVEVWVRVGDRLQLAGSAPTTNGPARETIAATEGIADRVAPGGAVVPVFHDGELLGALAVVKPRQGLNATEQRLVGDVASQAGLVFSRFRLFEELRESRSRIVAAQDVERRRIERDLHDGAQQRFVNALLALGMVKATNHGQAVSAELIDQASREVQAGLSELRALARGLHPPLLTESGLAAAVTSLADRSPIVTSINASTNRRYAEPVEVTAYFVIAEAIANAAKHSHASAIQVQIDEVSGRLCVEVRDDGVGGAHLGQGSGLVGLQDRSSAIGGTLSVQSASGHGTIVRAELPCE
jgi:signal transduction histidine kinase